MKYFYKVSNIVSYVLVIIGFALEFGLGITYVTVGISSRVLIFIGVGIYFFTWMISTVRKDSHLISKKAYRDNIVARFTRLIAMVLLSFGLIFKFLHWPWSSYLLLGAGIFGFISMLLYIFLPKKNMLLPKKDEVIDDFSDLER
jgi:hypothetical protein